MRQPVDCPMPRSTTDLSLTGLQMDSASLLESSPVAATSKQTRRSRGDEKGATMVEYCLMLALIALVCFAAVTQLGTSSSSFFNDFANTL
jgi:pilus assembly protein Flp/PilA